MGNGELPAVAGEPQLLAGSIVDKEEEVRRYEGKRKWCRRGWSIEERRLLEVVDRKLFEEPADLRELLPEKLAEPFTTRDLAEATGIGRQLAQKVAYCLRKVRVIELAGNRGRANLYEIAGPNETVEKHKRN